MTDNKKYVYAAFCIFMMFLSYHTGKVVEHRDRPPIIYVKMGDFNLNLYSALRSVGVDLTDAQKKGLATNIRSKKQ